MFSVYAHLLWFDNLALKISCLLCHTMRFGACHNSILGAKAPLGLIRVVCMYVCRSHKKFQNDRILIEWINDLWYDSYLMIKSHTVKYCTIFSNIAQSC